MRFQSKGSHCVWRSFELIVHNLLISFLQSHNGTSVDCISPAIHADRHNQIYRSGKGSPSMINVSNAHRQFLAHLYLYLHFMASFDVFGRILFGWVIFGWEYSRSLPSPKENNMQIILFHLNYLHQDRAICKWTCSYNRLPWLMCPTLLRNENCVSIKSEPGEIKVSP